LLVAAATATGANGQSVRISSLADINFGTIQNFVSDQSVSQTVCVYSTARSGAYQVTATGDGPANAFTLRSGSNRLAYEVQWADSAGQTVGASLAPGIPLPSQTSSTILSNCLFGLLPTASLIATLRASDINTAVSGNYSGTLTLLIAPD